MQAFDKKLEDMSNQVLQWQKQHQRDLEVLAAKEEQLRAFQEEMRALKESLLADGTEVGTPQLPAASSHCPRTSHDRLHDRHPLVGVGVPGSKERTPPLFSTKQGLGVPGPQRLSRPNHLPVTLLIEILNRAKVPIQRRENAISMSGTPAAPT